MLLSIPETKVEGEWIKTEIIKYQNLHSLGFSVHAFKGKVR